MNKVTLMGRLTAAPEVRYIPGEKLDSNCKNIPCG